MSAADDEVETFIGSQKTCIWRWKAVDHFRFWHLCHLLGDRSAVTFQSLWEIVSNWQCYFYFTDGVSVYLCFIPNSDSIVSQTYMTRVQGENRRGSHYLARLHRKILSYSK